MKYFDCFQIKMSGTGGSYKNYELSSYHYYNQRGNPISRETMNHRLEGPSSTLHIASDVHYRQLAVASRTTFKIYNIKDEGEISGPGKKHKCSFNLKIFCFLILIC